MSGGTKGRGSRTPRRRAILLCWVGLGVQAYAVLVFGASVPALLRYQPWGLDQPTVGLLGSLTVAGMLVGALSAGVVVDRGGRRPTLLVSVYLLFLGMLGCWLAPAEAVFGAARLVVGLGAGLMLPTASALVSEFAPAARRYFYQAAVFGGIGLGGALSALAAIATSSEGFRPLYGIGLLGSAGLLPVMHRWLPESTEYVNASRDDVDPRATFRRWGLLLHADYRKRTLLFWTTTFLSLLVLFGVYTWLPVMINRTGSDLGTSLGYLLVLNLGVIAGSLTASLLADRLGRRPVLLGSFTATAGGFALLAQSPTTGVGYVLVAVIGACAVNAQFLVNAYVGASYPTMYRGAALGSTLGIGRVGGVLGPLYGGWLVRDWLPVEGSFYGFALPALLAGLVIIAVPELSPGQAPHEGDQSLG